MVETKAKRARGRPKGSRNKSKPAGLRTPVEVPSFAEAYGKPQGDDEAGLAEVLEAWVPVKEPAGNGQEEHREEMHRQWEQSSIEPVEPAPARLHMQGSEGMWAAERPPEPKPRVVLPDLFVHRVENGYIVRPAYAQGDHRTSSDVRTWVVATKEQLAELVVELIAEPVVHATPQKQSQDYYSPPLIVETGVGPMS